MPIINFSNPITVLIGVVLFILVLYLAKEVKKSWVIGLLLFTFLVILIGHTVEFVTVANESKAIYSAVTRSATYDLIFIFLSFLSYLWIDDIESKEGKRKSIDNSLQWFWNKV